MINNNSPIGFFDSGLGGLSIWKEMNALLPNESTIYLADSKNAPYGEKSKQQIIDFSIKNTELLMQMGCKIIVVACNTATTNAIALLREKYQIPLIGIEPAIKPAALKTKTGVVGVLATRGTLNSDLFAKNSKLLDDDLKLLEVEGKGLVKLIESGQLNETKELLKKYIQPMLDSGIDSIVLGCTHYPFLIPIIQQIIPKNVTLIDSGKAVANQTQKVLKQLHLLNDKKNAKHQFITNSNEMMLSEFLEQVQIHPSNKEVCFRNF